VIRLPRFAVLAGAGVGVLLTLLPGVQASQTLPPLTEPLSLDQALVLANPAMPELRLAAADRAASEARLALAQSRSGLTLSAEGRLQWIEPSDAADNQENNDSQARLLLRKRLYDFGYSDALEEAARSDSQGSRWLEQDARQEAHLAIMRSFYDVVLADLQFARDSEAMAIAFIAADRARDWHGLGRVSDVDLLAAEADYRQALRLRAESQSLQRLARSRLALAMGRPGELVASVLPPGRPDTAVEVPPFEALLEDMLANNPRRRARLAEVEAARVALQAAANRYGPVVTGELEAGHYERETSSSHPFRAAVVIEIPLFTGGGSDAAVAAARAELDRRQARLDSLDFELREQLLQAWLRLEDLRVALTGLDVRADYRELYLDRSRALYELEVKADLGDAMTEISAVRLDTAQAEFDWLITLARIEAMTGNLELEVTDR
jgi:outer membrane protein TolC